MFSKAARLKAREDAALIPQPYAKGSAKVECHATKKEFTIAPSELTWELVSRFGKKSEVFYEGKVHHSSLGMLAWRVWDFPSEARDSTETDIGKHTLIQNFEIGLESEDSSNP